MSCVWIEGFESHINAAQLARKYASLTGTTSVQSGRVFGTAAGISSLVMVTPSIGASDNTFVLGFGVRLSSNLTGLNSNNQGLYIETGANEQCHLELESTLGLGIRFHLKRGGTIIDTTSYFDFAVWHYFELKVTVRDGTDGAYELRHNGVLAFSGTGVDLADNGTDGWDIFAFRYLTNAGTFLRYDDIYICNGVDIGGGEPANNDFLGPSIVEGLLPNGVGASEDFGNSATGDNYTFVDDIGTSAPDDVTTGGYVHSDTNGEKDTYEFQDLSQITGTIHAVQLNTQLAMSAAGTRTVKTVYRDPDTSEADGVSHVVDATIYDGFTEVFNANPTNGSAWDVNDIDNGQFGIEVVS